MASAIGDAKGVDLNSASEQELEKIGGLGQQRAKGIVEGRPFRSWEEVRKLEGFSDKLVDDLKEAGATVGEEK